jgi:hypothetical protein
MNYPASARQIEFLKNLGFKVSRNLSADEASALIDELLERENCEGVKLKCPACRKLLNERPRRMTPCPHCKTRIRDVTGKLYTERQLRARDHDEWFTERRAEVDDIVGERLRENCIPGFLIRIGPGCVAAQHFDGAFIPIKIAAMRPDLIPPYRRICLLESCECRAEELQAGDKIPKLIISADAPVPTPNFCDVSPDGSRVVHFSVSSPIINLLVPRCLVAWYESACRIGKRTVAIIAHNMRATFMTIKRADRKLLRLAGGDRVLLMLLRSVVITAALAIPAIAVITLCL